MTSTQAWLLVTFSGLTFLTLIIFHIVMISRRIVTSDQIDKLATKEIVKSTRELLETKIDNLEKILSTQIDGLEKRFDNFEGFDSHESSSSKHAYRKEAA